MPDIEINNDLFSNEVSVEAETLVEEIPAEEKSRIDQFDPQVDDIGEYYDFSRNQRYHYGHNLKKIRDTLKSPFLASEDKLESALLIAAHACYGKFPESMSEKTSDELWETSQSSDIINILSNDFPKLYLVATTQVGTHTGKIPNATVSLPKLTYQDEVFEAARDVHYLSSATIREKGFMGASGNAAEGKAQRFLITKIKIDDRVLSIKDWIVERGVVFDTFIKIGVNRGNLETLANALEQSIRSGNPNPPRLAKSLIWPSDDGQDIVITPVHSYAMSVAVHNRLGKYKKPDDLMEGDDIPVSRIWHSIPRSYYKVGGANPQNSGVLTSVLGGTYRVLESFPPNIKGNTDILYLVDSNGAVKLSRVSKKHDAVVRFVEALQAKNINDHQKKKQKVSMERIVGLSLYNWREFAIAFSPYQDDPSSLDHKTLDAMKDIEGRLKKPLLQLFSEGYKNMSVPDREFILNLILQHVQKIDGVGTADSIATQIRKIAEKQLMQDF